MKTFIVILFTALLSFSVFKAFENPGEVTLVWQGYAIETSSAFLITFAGILVLLAFWFGGLWTILGAAPAWFKNKHKWKASEKSVSQFVEGMEAASLGDVSKAEKMAKSIGSSQPKLQSVLLSHLGDSVSKDGLKLLENNTEDSSVLRLISLIKQAEKDEQWQQMHSLSAQAYKKNPKSEQLLYFLFNAKLHTGAFEEAYNLAEGMKLSTHYGAEELDNIKASLCVAIANERESAEDRYKWYKKALKAVPTFVPAMEALFKENPEGKDISKWLSACPHELVVEMAHVSLQTKDEKKREKLWSSMLKDVSKHHANYEHYVKSVYKEQQNNLDDAYFELKKASESLENQHIYRKLALLEQKRNGSDTNRVKWLEKALDETLANSLIGDAELSFYKAFKAKYPVQNQPAPTAYVGYVS